MDSHFNPHLHTDGAQDEELQVSPDLEFEPVFQSRLQEFLDADQQDQAYAGDYVPLSDLEVAKELGIVQDLINTINPVGTGQTDGAPQEDSTLDSEPFVIVEVPETHSSSQQGPQELASNSSPGPSTGEKVSCQEPAKANLNDKVRKQRNRRKMKHQPTVYWGVKVDWKALAHFLNSADVDEADKHGILAELPDGVLDKPYTMYRIENPQRHRFRRQPLWHPYSRQTFIPLFDEGIDSSSDSNASPSGYPAYSGHFRNADEARVHRKRSRLPPKGNAIDVQHFKRHRAEKYWLRQINHAMTDALALEGAEASGFDPWELEATAQHIFDKAVAVHELGRTRSKVRHKKAVRGKLNDTCERRLEKSLALICICLKQNKSMVDDAVRGGVTLALLSDNPAARIESKKSNNQGNRRRGKRQAWVKLQEKCRRKKAVEEEVVDKKAVDEKVANEPLFGEPLFGKSLFIKSLFDKQVIEKEVIEKEVIEKEVVEKDAIDEQLFNDARVYGSTSSV